MNPQLPIARIAVVGDYDVSSLSHAATLAALTHAAAFLQVPLDARWFSTASLREGAATVLAGFSGVHIAPGSPYESMDGALHAITHARAAALPLLACCGGYQHVVIEFARRVLGVADAAHAEYDPSASRLFIAALPCSLVGRRLEIRVRPGTLAARAYGAASVQEEYYCNFGLAAGCDVLLERGGLRASGRDTEGEARILELATHPFYLATLFVPARRSTPNEPHPLFVAFLEACLAAGGAPQR